MGPHQSYQTTWGTGLCYGSRRSRGKHVWAGPSHADAFRHQLDYYPRLQGQRLFNDGVREIQKEVAKQIGGLDPDTVSPRVKAQLAPCYTTFPLTLAVPAAWGLTAFLEYKAWVEQPALFGRLEAYFNERKQLLEAVIHGPAYEIMTRKTCEWVDTRLLILDMERSPRLNVVETYRLFSAAQEPLRFRSLEEILRVAILYGELLPALETFDPHPLASRMLEDLLAVNRQFVKDLRGLSGFELVEWGEVWAREVCELMEGYLPPPQSSQKNGGLQLGSKNSGGAGADPDTLGLAEPGSASFDRTRIPPLEGKFPPVVGEFQDVAEHIVAAMTSEEPTGPGSDLEQSGQARESEAAKILEAFSGAVTKAGGQERQWEDLRSDRVEQQLVRSPFGAGPIEGDVAEGHDVQVPLAEGLVAGGQIFDRAVELCDDLSVTESLRAEALPFTRALRRNLYPNLRGLSRTSRLCTTGLLDPMRLHLAEFAAAVYQRHPVEQVADPRGNPLLVIACDGSGSLNTAEMKMLKLLTVGWLESTAKSRIRVLAALYHSGQARKQITGPLVQWIYAPKTSLARNSLDAVRAVAMLPDSGTGMQSDALSLGFILQEARRLAGGEMIYLVVISDCQWNQSFHMDLTGHQEVLSLFEHAVQDLPGRLHTTLVALGVSGPTGFESVLDAVIPVSARDLDDAAKVASRVGLYVASCIKSRTRWLSRH